MWTQSAVFDVFQVTYFYQRVTILLCYVVLYCSTTMLTYRKKEPISIKWCNKIFFPPLTSNSCVSRPQNVFRLAGFGHRRKWRNRGFSTMKSAGMNLGGVELDASQVLRWVEDTHRVAYKVKKIKEDTLDMSFCRYCERCWWDNLNQKTTVIEFFAKLNRKELDFTVVTPRF